MNNDPIIEEVRKHRREIEVECNDDFTLIFSKAKEKEHLAKNHLITEPVEKSYRNYSSVKEMNVNYGKNNN